MLHCYLAKRIMTGLIYRPIILGEITVENGDRGAAEWVEGGGLYCLCVLTDYVGTFNRPISAV
jgi:hypothetical protein